MLGSSPVQVQMVQQDTAEDRLYLRYSVRFNILYFSVNQCYLTVDHLPSGLTECSDGGLHTQC